MAKKSKDQTPQVKTGVGVIVCKGHKVLVGERTGSHGEGSYAFPGGHLEHSDALKQHPLGGLGACGEREVLEETGIICRVFSPDNYRKDLFTTFDILSEDGQKVYVTPYLIADYLHGGTLIKHGDKEMVKPLEPDKCKGWQWATLDELATMVNSEKQKTWIPIHEVLYYLKQLWRIT
jgi:8-oxo-dGTP diphosphatase